MSMQSRCDAEEVSQDLFHDFNSKTKLILVLGGYTVIKKTVTYFALNILLIISVAMLYIYLITMAVVTMVYTTDQKVIMWRASQSLYVLIIASMMPCIRLLTRHGINDAISQLKSGFYVYNEDCDEGQLKIVKDRVIQIKKVDILAFKVCLVCAISLTLFEPLIALVFGTGDNNGQTVNPYLPLPIYMPFDTKTRTGYAIAFFTEFIFIGFSFTCLSCFITLYLSCALQLIAQFEVLEYSLNNIEKRAQLKMVKHIFTFERVSENGLYDVMEFQHWLYICLRENILHHQAILRFRNSIISFMEKSNFAAMLVYSIFMASSIMAIRESPGFQIVAVLYLLVGTLLYIQMCTLAQLITDKSAQIKETIYSMPWPLCDRSFKVLMSMMITNSQNPVILKAAGFNAPVNLSTFADMISAGYKLINVLR